MRDTHGVHMGGGAASFGYWVRRRRLALDLTQAALARRTGCSAAAIKKIEHDERRPSRMMAARLAEALVMPPDQRDRFVAAGLGELAAARLGPAIASADRTMAPPWLSDPLGAEPRQVVGRDDELAGLLAHLEAMLDGHGRMVFVTGEAGQGKTTLLTAFADRAQQAAPDLVVTRGAGTAVGSYGDPYLVVRDVFRTLVADARTPWRSDYVSPEQAASLWAFAPKVARTIDEVGPHLLDVVVPADAVRAQLGLDEIPLHTARPSRDHVVAEVTDVLRALSAERPLLVLLDDIQWADTASAELLFHLLRRLRDSRVLVVCAYRGSEVAEDHGPAGRGIRLALTETRRDVSDARIDLDDIGPTAERALCDALLDLEIPDLDSSLHDELYRKTRGQPLFVQELTRELKGRGDLVLGREGSWVARPGLDWDQVPARVAVVIEQRLDRLEPADRTLLDAAATEGEHFTVEAAARVAGVDERAALRLLARHADRAHGLVREVGIERLDGRTLTRYRFGHVLFQRFIYEALSDGARQRIHGQLAAELERLHADDLDSILSQLVHHFSAAGDAARAIPYLIQAGDRARLMYAHDEAVRLYERASQFLRSQGDLERMARTQMKIGLTYQTGADLGRAQQAFDDAFSLWSSVDQTTQGVPGAATLRLIWAEPQTLDPTMGGYEISASMVTNLLSGLVRFDEGTNVVPDVARRWEITDGGRRYTFHLRDDVVWSDGRPVTAHDFVYTYRRALDPVTGAPVAPALLDAVAGARDVREGRVPPGQAGIHAVGDHTLVIELAEPTSYFIYNLAYYVLLPVPRHAVEAHGASWWRQPDTTVSNGPFRLNAWEHGRSMTLERNPGYHRSTRGNVQRVTLRLERRPAAEHEALYLTDEVDVLSTAWFTAESVADRLRRRLPAEYSRRDRFVTRYYWLDPDRPPLNDRRLRQAMTMAIDRDAVAALWSHGLAIPAAGGLVPPGMPGHVPNLALPHDPDRAARLVAEVAANANLPEITLFCLASGEQAARELADGWRAAGIPIRIQCEMATGLFASSWESTTGPRISLGGWVADYPDPDTFLRVCAELDLPNWRHDRLQNVLGQAARTTDPAARLASYQVVERILADEAVLVPLTYNSEHLMIKPWVTHYPSIPVKYAGFWQDITIGPDQHGLPAAT